MIADLEFLFVTFYKTALGFWRFSSQAPNLALEQRGGSTWVHWAPPRLDAEVLGTLKHEAAQMSHQRNPREPGDLGD